MDQVVQLEPFAIPQTDGAPTPNLEDQVVDLRFPEPAVDLTTRPIDLGFASDPPSQTLTPPDLSTEDVVVDLRDAADPVIVFPDAPVVRWRAQPGADAAPAERVGSIKLPAPAPVVHGARADDWSRPDIALQSVVNRARFRQGGVAAVSGDRTDLTELAVLASRGGRIDARLLARLARDCR
jgi:hypothetical protein